MPVEGRIRGPSFDVSALTTDDGGSGEGPGR